MPLDHSCYGIVYIYKWVYIYIYIYALLRLVKYDTLNNLMSIHIYFFSFLIDILCKVCYYRFMVLQLFSFFFIGMEKRTYFL